MKLKTIIRIISHKTPVVFFGGFLVLFFSFNLSSQVSFDTRLELNARDQFSNKKVIPIAEKGLIIQSLSTEHRDDHRVLKLDHYDTNLTIQGTIKHLIHKLMKPFKVVKEDDVIHSFFHDTKGSYTVISIEINGFKKRHIHGVFTEQGKIHEAFVREDYAFMLVQTDMSYYLYSLNLKTGRTINKKIIPFQFELNGFSNLKLVPSSISGYCYLYAVKNGVKTQQAVLRKYDNELKDVEDFNLGSLISLPIKDFKLNDTDTAKLVLTGTYSHTPKQKGSEGVFIYNLTTKNLTKRSFLKQEAFLSYLPPKEEEKKQKKITGKNTETKPVVNIRTNLHDVIVNDSLIYFATEFFYHLKLPEQYQLDKNTGKMLVGGHVGKEIKQYTHVLLWCFNRNHEFVFARQINHWTSYRIANEEPPSNLNYTKDEINLLLPDRDKIVSFKLNKKGETISAENQQLIELPNIDDYLDMCISKIDGWYRDNYLLYGYQHIANDDTKELDDREVFYLYKIAY